LTTDPFGLSRRPTGGGRVPRSTSPLTTQRRVGDPVLKSSPRRLHGPDQHHLYAGSYPDDDLRWWAERIREWSTQGREMFNCFNNDGHGHAVRKAETLRGMLRC